MDHLTSSKLFDSAQPHQDLAWSALPSAPVVPEREQRGALRRRLAALLRGAADRIDVRRPARPAAPAPWPC